MNSAAQEYKVEGHGAGTLVVKGGELRRVRRPNSYSVTLANAPLLTREEAWKIALSLMVEGFHTVKVTRKGETVFRAFHQVGGEWIDAKTTKVVKPATVAS